MMMWWGVSLIRRDARDLVMSNSNEPEHVVTACPSPSMYICRPNAILMVPLFILKCAIQRINYMLTLEVNGIEIPFL